MLTEILNRVAAQPDVYDAPQVLAGSATVNRRVARRLGELPRPDFLLDLGGGTGLARALWPEDGLYVCLDLDPPKLRGFQRKHPHGVALAGDATRLRVRSHCFDLVVCKNVSHHLDDPQLPLVFREESRALRPGGHMLFEDAVSDAARWRSRVMWLYDRGSFPRSGDVLKRALAELFEIVHWKVFAIHHRYVLGVCSAPAPRR